MADCRRGERGVVERTGYRFMCRWRVAYYPDGEDDGMTTEVLHLTKLGALLSRWLWL